MEVAGVSLPLVFAAGVVSFVSPCVLPLVPGYLATVSGVSFERIAGALRASAGRWPWQARSSSPDFCSCSSRSARAPP